MDKKNKKHFINLLAKLKKEKEALLKDYETKMNENHGSENSSYPFHSADLGSDAAMMEKLSVNINNIMNEIRLIDEALDNISEGTYGICEMCGSTIPKKRLNAIPFAKLCLDCKDKIKG